MESPGVAGMLGSPGTMSLLVFEVEMLVLVGVAAITRPSLLICRIGKASPMPLSITYVTLAAPL